MNLIRGIRTKLPGALLAVTMIAGMSAGVNAQTPAPYVRVFIDGQPVAFDVPPVIASGRVLVSLRGVFQQLGASVTWDPSTQTVLAERTDTSVVLRIGDTQARINGQLTLMDVPALLVSGRTMVPLRFVSQALGSPVSWDAASATIQITSQATVGVPPSQTYPAPPPPSPQPPVGPPLAPATTTVTGTVVSVNAGIYPGQLQVQVGNAVYAYRVVPTTAVTRVNVATNAGGSVALDAVRPGDQVQVTVDQSGTAQAIQVAYREVSGKVIAVTDAGVVVLENGDSFRLNRSVQVVRNGTAVDASTLRPGDVVTMRVNPQTNEVWAVTVRQEPATVTSVNVTPSGRELRVGDVVEVVAAGTPGGRTTFSIGQLRTAVPMVESTAQRGTYYGSYTIQPGDSIQGAEVTVRLTAPDGQVSTATAPTRVQINAAGAPAPATTTVTGTVVSVNAGIYPGQLQVQVGNAVYAYRVVSTTAVTRVNVATNAGGSVALDAVRPGDQVQVTVDQSGTAQAIQVAYREVSGKVIAVTDAGVVVLENGDSFRLNRSVQVVRNGTAVDASTLRPGDVVTMRVNPQTNEVWAVTVRQEPATVTSVNVTPSGRELRVGDVVEVVAAGTPGGRTTFSIGQLRTAVPMVESTAQRGTYYGSYTIQPGDSIQGAEVTVRLTAPDGQVSTATAPTRVQINAAGAVPPAASAPTILSPANGSSIKSPFTVTGVAPPGSQVKVTADYSRKVLLLFDVNGTLGTQVVTADRNGHWSTTFTQGPSVSGVTVTITAVVVDGDGHANSSAATVTTTLD